MSPTVINLKIDGKNILISILKYFSNTKEYDETAEEQLRIEERLEELEENPPRYNKVLCFNFLTSKLLCEFLFLN